MNVLAILLAGAVSAQDTAPVRIWFLDVGQADATVIVSPGGRVALVDGGRSARRLLPVLDHLDVDTIDLVVASHAHADHIGGLDEVLLNRPVRYYLDNGVVHNTATYRSLMYVVESSGVTYLQPTDRTITLDSVALRVLPPWAEAQTARDQNNASVGLLLEYGTFRALLVGDAEQAELNYFLGIGIPQVAVLKASHHGARNGVTPGWIQSTRPRVVVISVGAKNSYGHPDQMALRYYGLYAKAVYRTDRHGDILVEARRDGSFTVTCWDHLGNGSTRTFTAMAQ